MAKITMRRNANTLRDRRRIRDEFYDYEKAVKENALEALEDYDEVNEIEDVDDLVEFIDDKLWNDDSVTGNASGSYTFDRYKAMKYVVDNMDLLNEALDEFYVDNSTIGEKFRNEEWEYFDVTIRCFVLNQLERDIAEEFRKRHPAK